MRPIEHERCRKALFDFMADGLQDHQGNMWSTIVWMNKVLIKKSSGRMSDEDYYLNKAIRELSTQEINQIIHELTMESFMHSF